MAAWIAHHMAWDGDCNGIERPKATRPGCQWLRRAKPGWFYGIGTTILTYLLTYPLFFIRFNSKTWINSVVRYYPILLSSFSWPRVHVNLLVFFYRHTQLLLRPCRYNIQATITFIFEPNRQNRERMIQSTLLLEEQNNGEWVCPLYGWMSFSLIPSIGGCWTCGWDWLPAVSIVPVHRKDAPIESKSIVHHVTTCLLHTSPFVAANQCFRFGVFFHHARIRIGRKRNLDCTGRDDRSRITWIGRDDRRVWIGEEGWLPFAFWTQ